MDNIKCENMVNGKHKFPPDVFKLVKFLGEYIDSPKEKEDFERLVVVAEKTYREHVNNQLRRAWESAKQEVDVAKISLFVSNDDNKRVYQSILGSLVGDTIGGYKYCNDCAQKIIEQFCTPEWLRNDL